MCTVADLIVEKGEGKLLMESYIITALKYLIVFTAALKYLFVFTGVQGAGPLAEVARGLSGKSWKILYF